MSLDNDIPIPVTCPNCNKVFERTLAQFQSNPTINCPCGVVTKVDTKEAAATLKEIQRRLDDLSRQFS